MKGMRGSLFKRQGKEKQASQDEGNGAADANGAAAAAPADSWQTGMDQISSKKKTSRRGGGDADTASQDGSAAPEAPRGRLERASAAREVVDNAARPRPSYKAAFSSNRDGPGGDDESIPEEEESSSSSEEPAAAAGDAVNPATTKARMIEKSAGTNRLNRILSRQEGMYGVGDDDDPARNFLFNRVPAHKTETTTTTSTAGTSHHLNSLLAAGGVVERIADPKNTAQVASFCSRVVVPPLRIDRHTIGGHLVEAGATGTSAGGYPAETMQQETLLCFRCQAFETSGADTVALSALQYPADYKKHKRSLGLYGGMASTTAKGRNKFRYVVLARSTNRPLIRRAAAASANKALSGARDTAATDTSQLDGSERGDYDKMFAPDTDEDMSKDLSLETGEDSLLNTAAGTATTDSNTDDTAAGSGAATNADGVPTVAGGPGSGEGEAATVEKMVPPEEEISSFPVLICMTLHSSGTAPDIRKLVRLDQLTTVQDLHTTVVQLAFSNGDTIRLDFGNAAAPSKNGGANANGAAAEDEYQAVEGAMDKERFIWSLLQVHAMLCVSVTEFMQSSAIAASATSPTAAASAAAAAGSTEALFLPPLNVRNLNRAELQYVATVNGFLRKSETLVVLLERQKRMMEQAAAAGADGGAGVLTAPTQKIELEEMDSMAYDLMMGNFASRIRLFNSEEERKDAEEVLNSTEWTGQLRGGSGNVDGGDDDNGDGSANNNNETSATAALSIAERLSSMLQWRMRDLEAETCRRLIAWEDEKHYSVTGKSKFMGDMDQRDSVDALALASLFKTLESLDGELVQMEEWLQDRAAAIKPLTDDCADIEEENRQLEQQWKSYETLGSEIRRLLTGLDINSEMERALKNPASVLVYEDNGSVDVDESEAGVEQIYDAGKALQEAMEYPRRSGGMHLRAVSERAKGLNKIANGFCKQLAQIIVTVMEQFKTEVVAGSDYGKVSKSDTHSMIAKKIRDTQRKFQSALLGYLKLIEILIALSPEMLPALRDAYSEMVSEGILMKKRMKGYFQALPGKNAAYLNVAGKDLKDYTPAAGATGGSSSGAGGADHSSQLPIRYEGVNARDIKAALTELLPVIAREAYFTSALFGTSTKDQDGREKKRNFENAKAAVGNSSQHFRYYINRTCGILSKELEERAKDDDRIRSDPLLCLVASIYLNEVMDNYIDREKKGGDHSLSLAYVRATILDLRKRADKQWVAWVDRQIEWIRTNDGVPLNGKRAGVFPSFARFFSYVDHVIYCCREGRSADYSPDLAGIKVISYYMQKMASALLESLRDCANRETTDKQYASNVMQMENTYFFTQAVKERGPEIEKLFAKQVIKANAICKDSTDAYLGWMIKREFTTLHELFSRVSKMRKDVGDSEVAKNIPKSQFTRTLTKEANRDILKEKIGSMHSRMEKHLHEDGKLLPVAWKALVKVLYEWFGRWEKMSSAIYRHKLDPSPVNVVRIAKAVGGGAKPRQQASGSEFAFKSILALGSNAKSKEETA